MTPNDGHITHRKGNGECSNNYTAIGIRRSGGNLFRSTTERVDNDGYWRSIDYEHRACVSENLPKLEGEKE